MRKMAFIKRIIFVFIFLIIETPLLFAGNGFLNETIPSKQNNNLMCTVNQHRELIVYDPIIQLILDTLNKVSSNLNFTENGNSLGYPINFQLGAGSDLFDPGWSNLPRGFYLNNGKPVYCRFVGEDTNNEEKIFISCDTGNGKEFKLQYGMAYWKKIPNLRGLDNFPRFWRDANKDGIIDWCRTVPDTIDKKLKLQCILGVKTSNGYSFDGSKNFEPLDFTASYLSASQVIENELRICIDYVYKEYNRCLEEAFMGHTNRQLCESRMNNDKGRCDSKYNSNISLVYNNTIHEWLKMHF